MLLIGSKRKLTNHVTIEAARDKPADHQDHRSSTGSAGVQQQMRPSSSNSYSTGATASAALLEQPTTSKGTSVACRHANTNSTSHAASAVSAHCSSGVLAPHHHNALASPDLLITGTQLLAPLSSCKGENGSIGCLQDSSLQAGTYKAASTHRQFLQDTAPVPPAVPTFSTKAFEELTAGLEEDDLGCAAAACLTASAGKHHHSQRTAPAAQQQVVQQQPAVHHPEPHHHQQQQHLLTSPSQQPKYGSFKAGSGFRRLQTTPGTAMFGAVLNNMPDDDTDTEGYSDDDHEQPVAKSRACRFTMVLQQELQGQLGATAASKGIGSAGTSGGPEHVPAGLAAPTVGHSSSHVLGSSRSSQQDRSPTRAALVASASAAAATAAAGNVSHTKAADPSHHQRGPAGQAVFSSVAADEASTAAQAAGSSPGSTPIPAEGDAEQFLVACLQPGVVQALAVLVHADILPLCSEDGSGTLMATLAYMLILASRSSILRRPAHPASSSSAVQAASSASDTHKLLTLLWMAESFSSQYRDSCKLVLFNYMFYPACLSVEDPTVTSILQPHTLVCVQLQAAILGASSFRLWVQPEELAAACQALVAAKGGSCLVFLQAAVQAQVCKLQQQVQQQLKLLQQLQMAQQKEEDDDLAIDQQAERVLAEAQQLQQHEQVPASQQLKQPGAGSGGLLQPQQQQQHAQAGTSRQAPQNEQQLAADNSRAAKKPRVAVMPPPPQQQQQRRRSQRRSAKGAAAFKSAGGRQQQDVVQVNQPLQELQQNVGGRQTRSSSRIMAAAQTNSRNQKPGGSCISGAARTGMLPAASAAAGKAAAMLQSTMRSAKQQLLQMASSLGKRTHQMHSGSKCGSTKQ